jgi:hypothetical protein
MQKPITIQNSLSSLSKLISKLIISTILLQSRFFFFYCQSVAVFCCLAPLIDILSKAFDMETISNKVKNFFKGGRNMAKARILKNLRRVEDSAIKVESSKFIRIVVRSIPQEQDFLLDMWENPEKYESCYLLPLLSQEEVRLPPWFTPRGDCCTECVVVDQNGDFISYVELPERLYLYKHYEELEEKKRKNSFSRKLFHKIFKILSLKLC